MTEERCRCRDCRAGDALPDRLQGWPGAWQPRLIPTIMERRAAMPIPQPRSLDDWNYPGIRDACANRCGEFGDPPCHELRDRHDRAVNADSVDAIKPCGDCWRDVGIEPGDEFDHNAAVRPLL